MNDRAGAGLEFLADGYEVAHRLRQRGDAGEVVIVALTGYGQREDRERALVAGFDDHLVKPVSFDDLQRVVSGLPPQREWRA